MQQQTVLGGVLGPQLARLLHRFPWSVLAALVFAAYFFFGLHRPVGVPPDVTMLRLVRIPSGLSAAFLWSLVVTLFAEARGIRSVVRHVVTVAGWLALAGLIAFADVVQLMPALVIGGLLLAVGVTPYLRHGVAQAAYWRFNHDTWIGFLAAGIACLLFGLGLSAIVETLRYLFGFNLSYEVHERIWAIACGVVGPLYWASVIPEDFASEVSEGTPTDFLSRMVALLVKFILVPLLLVYAVILHVYAGQIGLDGTLPKGRLGWLVLLYGAMTVLTALLAFPTRQSSGALVSLFWRAWPWFLIVPLVLLFIAVGTRIDAYGVTESRYWVVLVGVWLGVLAITHGLGLFGRDLRLMPAVLSALVLASCLGPWGMTGWTHRSQIAEFGRALAAAGLMENGRVKPGIAPKIASNTPEALRLNDKINFFMARRRLDVLKPFFAGDAADPFAVTAKGPNDWQTAQRVRERLGIDKSFAANHSSPNFATYTAQSPTIAALPDGTWLMSGLRSTRDVGREATTVKQEVALGGLKLVLRLDDARLLVEESSGDRRAVFDLAPLDKTDGPLRKLPGPEPRASIVLEPTEGALPVTLIINQISATRGGTPPFTVNGLSYSLLVRDKR
ncbi:MAG: DUF4153 domain-containing protein [Hyphomicrobiaceae bacterium]